MQLLMWSWRIIQSGCWGLETNNGITSALSISIPQYARGFGLWYQGVASIDLRGDMSMVFGYNAPWSQADLGFRMLQMPLQKLTGFVGDARWLKSLLLDLQEAAVHFWRVLGQAWP